jgi:hypothetical protein
MNGDEFCTCGHTWEEHEETRSSTPPCEIDGCDCIAFEEGDPPEE